MNFDFPAFLVLASAVTGGIWLVDALAFAPKRRAGAAAASVVRREPMLVEYARSFFPVILIVLLLRSFLVEPFRIPSNSMMPTLLTGDFILVNKFAYGLRLPVLNTKFLPIGEPRHGDVVVFKYPVDGKTDYIKRIVGVPGDQVSYRDKTIYLNGKPQGQVPIGLYTGVASGAGMTGARDALETLDGVEHHTLAVPGRPDLPPGCRVLALGSVTVPPGHYFVMGDNRDNSNDSRCWGFVPEGNLVGKAFAIWMHWDGERTGFPPIAWGRLGHLIQ
ncbi:signal peptidase I [uncultured Thiodictyon sp.]|uniref:signal peptidase I n=1 Tax=uncultured Thiodictyon sp. TaxID=1846217 RepID=UPI0025DA9267|nr:signal peptidase I [uncultured Thiodictyon sp.]